MRTVAQDYGVLNSDERASLFIRAVAREDDRDADKLLRTSPDQRFWLPHCERLVLAMDMLAMEYQVCQLKTFATLLILQRNIASELDQERRQLLKWRVAVGAWAFEQEREAFESFCSTRGLEVGHFGGADGPVMRMACNKVLLILIDDGDPARLSVEYGHTWPSDVEDSNVRTRRYEAKLDSAVAMLY